MNLIPINNLDDPWLSLYARASEAQLLHVYEPAEGVFIAETANVVIRALEAGYRLESLLVETDRMDVEARPVFDKVRELYGQQELDTLPVYVAEHEVVSRLTGYNLVRGLWAIVRRKPLTDPVTFCRDKCRLAVLYDIVNPTNVGAIIRSAAALGMDGALLTKPSVNPLTRRSARVSMGTVFQIPWTITEESYSLPRLLKEQGFTNVAMALTDNSITPDDSSLKNIDRMAIFLGTEGTGLPKEVIDGCDIRVRIPMGNGVDSLNVAAASAVIFWELRKS